MKKLILSLCLILSACQAAQPTNGTNTTFSLPGQSYNPFGYTWTKEGTPNQELVDLTKNFKTPEDITAYLQATREWDDSYDMSEFISPNQFAEGHKSVCTGFARFWVYSLSKIGVHADFVTLYKPNWGHAIAVFRSPTDSRYHIASNQYYYNDKTQDIDMENEGRGNAIQNAVRFFLSDQWTDFQVWDENGNIIDSQHNAAKPPSAPITAASTKNIFVYKK